MRADKPKFKTSDEVDFVIVGSGAAGGILAKELSTSGFRVVVLEQGPYLTEADFTHDEVKVFHGDFLTNHPQLQPNTFRKTPDETAKAQRAVVYGCLVGGTSVHFTANFWRFHEIDFIERSKIGPVPGANLVDWPITYADLEPYYTKVEWEVGVSGLANSSPFDPPRSKPFPMPPLPVKGCGVVFERGAQAGLASVPCALGHLVAAASRAQCLRELRFLPGLWLRSRRQVQFSSRRHSFCRTHRPLRNSAQCVRPQDRSGRQRPHPRCRLFRREAQHVSAKSKSSRGLREWRRDAAPPSTLREQTIPKQPGQLQRLCGQASHAQ